MPTDEFRWETPPPKGGGRPHTKYAPVAAKLRTRPGVWGMVRTTPSASTSRTCASNIRLGDIAAFLPRGTFEATHREVDGQWRVYARFVGRGLS